MRTFHQKFGEHHGMSVVVDTTGSRIYAGRFQEEHEDCIVLVHADLLDVSVDTSRTREEFVALVAEFGVHNRHARIEIPSEEIASFRLLKDLR